MTTSTKHCRSCRTPHCSPSTSRNNNFRSRVARSGASLVLYMFAAPRNLNLNSATDSFLHLSNITHLDFRSVPFVLLPRVRWPPQLRVLMLASNWQSTSTSDDWFAAPSTLCELHMPVENTLQKGLQVHFPPQIRSLYLNDRGKRYGVSSVRCNCRALCVNCISATNGIS